MCIPHWDRANKCSHNFNTSQVNHVMLSQAKKLKSVGMTLKKGKEQDGMMLAKVKEQDGIMLANVKVPSIPTSAACCDNVQLTIAESSSYTFTTIN